PSATTTGASTAGRGSLIVFIGSHEAGHELFVRTALHESVHPEGHLAGTRRPVQVTAVVALDDDPLALWAGRKTERHARPRGTGLQRLGPESLTGRVREAA